MSKKLNITILGAGNLGTAIANGLVQSKQFQADQIILTRRRTHLLDQHKEQGFKILNNNIKAIKNTDVIIVAVEPQQLNDLLEEICTELIPEKHILISVVSAVGINQIKKQITKNITVIRAMPNTAIAIRESITCIASEDGNDRGIEVTKSIFNTVGRTLVIAEEEMTAATALGACGIAFFLRAIRAASQGGIEIGFHANDALTIAAQTAKGAAALLLNMEKHPEYEIDKVTTPRGCTISGLNQMEHDGFSSAMIKGIVTSAEKASKLYFAKQN